MPEGSLTYTSNIFYLTNNLRWKLEKKSDNSTDTIVLQQAWENGNGEVEWRDVPVEEEAK
jgi:activator of HSP90 ATPase